MESMVRYISIFVFALLLVGCKNRINSSDFSDRHSESYIKLRIDSIYSRFNNPTYNENGKRIIDYRYNYDSAFCSSHYKKLMSKAIELMDDEEDIILEHDHWTNSQDPEDFTYKINKIEKTTDSTAIVVLNARNWGDDYLVTLRLLYEREDWFVDDFITKYGFKSEKAYLNDYIKKHTYK